jgi:hypothetical protein
LAVVLSCIPRSVPLEIVHAVTHARHAVEGLDLGQKWDRLRQDEQYLAWLDRWYSRFNPGYKNTWDSSSRWVHNPK